MMKRLFEKVRRNCRWIETAPYQTVMAARRVVAGLSPLFKIALTLTGLAVGMKFGFKRINSPNILLYGGLIPGHVVAGAVALMGVAALFRYARGGKDRKQAAGGSFRGTLLGLVLASVRLMLVGVLIAALTVGAFNPVRGGIVYLRFDTTGDEPNTWAWAPAMIENAAAMIRARPNLDWRMDPYLRTLVDRQLAGEPAKSLAREWRSAIAAGTQPRAPLYVLGRPGEGELADIAREVKSQHLAAVEAIVISPWQPTAGVPWPVAGVDVRSLWVPVGPTDKQLPQMAQVASHRVGNDPIVPPTAQITVWVPQFGPNSTEPKVELVQLISNSSAGGAVETGQVIVLDPALGGPNAAHGLTLGRDFQHNGHYLTFHCTVPTDFHSFRMRVKWEDESTAAFYDQQFDTHTAAIQVDGDPELLDQLMKLHPSNESDAPFRRTADPGRAGVKWVVGNVHEPAGPTVEIIFSTMPWEGPRMRTLCRAEGFEGSALKSYFLRAGEERGFTDLGSNAASDPYRTFVRTILDPNSDFETRDSDRRPARASSSQPTTASITAPAPPLSQVGAPVLFQRTKSRPDWITLVIPPKESLSKLDESHRSAVGRLLALATSMAERAGDNRPAALFATFMGQTDEQALPCESGAISQVGALDSQIWSGVNSGLDDRTPCTPGNSIRADAVRLALVSLASIFVLIAISCLGERWWRRRDAARVNQL